MSKQPDRFAYLPKYVCHKVVRAEKIERCEEDPSTGMVRLFPANGSAPIDMDADFRLTKRPIKDGYLVVYEDGYTSWSPTKAFEEGYRLASEEGASA